MNDAKIQAYRDSTLINASGAELVFACFREAQKALAEAREHIQAGTAASSYGSLERVRKIYTHLYSTLDLAAGGELAIRMQQIYAYVIEQTMVIATSYDLEQLATLETITNDMKTAWQSLATQHPLSAPGHPVRSIATSA